MIFYLKFPIRKYFSSVVCGKTKIFTFDNGAFKTLLESD